MRERLPEERLGNTTKFEILVNADEKPVDLYLTVNTYPDGRVGEVFARIDRMGSLVSGMLDGAMIALSVALQHGAPLADIVGKFRGMRFEPMGRILNFRRPDGSTWHCSSLLDLIGQHLLEIYPDGKVKVAA